MIENKEYKLIFPEAGDGGLIESAVQLVNSYYQQKLMLAADKEHYKGLAKDKKLVIAVGMNGDVVGTAAYVQHYPKDIWEFGGWAVDYNYQKVGMGVNLIKKLFTENLHWKTIAFGNKNSGPIFGKLGATVVNDHSVIPEEAFALCLTCPNKPKVGCCDTIYNLGPVIMGFILEKQHAK
jgi:N-acetylglutamate synthase-like GNAT family acetyltransferase